MPEAIVTIEDAADIRASLDGDGEAYARIVRRYQQEIGRLLWRFSRDRQVCEELTQDVFVEAYFALRGFRGRSPLGHWLARIATRVGYRHWQSERRRREAVTLPEDLVSSSGTPEALTPAQAAEVLHATLARLPPRDRLVLTLMYLEERSVAEVAALTGWTKTMVKVQAHRARNRLRKLIDPQEPDA